MEKGKWIGGISDGLTLGCDICHEHTKFDYKVDSDFWNRIVPDVYRRGVICLECLDRIAQGGGYNIADHLIEVQFAGLNKTIVLKPTTVYTY